MGPFVTLSEACLHSGGCSCWLLACKEKSWDGFVCLSSFCCNHCAILSAVNSKLYIRMHPWQAVFLFLSHLLVCHSKKNPESCICRKIMLSMGSQECDVPFTPGCGYLCNQTLPPDGKQRSWRNLCSHLISWVSLGSDLFLFMPTLVFLLSRWGDKCGT